LLTLQQERYASSELQYHSEIASPDKARVQNYLGYAFMLASRNVEARPAFSHALQLDTAYYLAQYKLLRLDAAATQTSSL
jgi:Flp pilus assembly protein TadD